ncbi:unnamed protein product [Symbiodinium natans]|uniref:Uncharacterized protein n=1 Tax=Symbiodinium natans TaxID=878477 RepID=A0A812NQH9_9DINO|nr:unnamed protein product [Symbiodinium natans]
MELTVESVDGFSLPNNCFIGVRVGDVLKQGRYEPHRCYHFPQIDRRRNAKVDIYQHVGTCLVAVDPDTKSSHEVSVTSMDPALPGTRIRINVQAKTEDGRANREERAKALKAQARDYLLKHNIEERLSDAVKALLKEQPKDPTNFLCNHLRAEAELPKAEAAPAEPQAEDPGCQIFEDDELNAIRKQSRDAFLQASEDGNLERALRELRPGVTEEAASKELTEAEKEKAKKDAIRAKASNVLINAAENGDLERALQLVKTDSQAQAPAPAARDDAEFRRDGPQQAARDDAQPEFRSYYAQHVRTVAPDSMQKLYANFPGQPKPAPAQVSGGAEVAADSKAILLRDPAVTGPALMALGMQPGLQFI